MEAIEKPKSTHDHIQIAVDSRASRPTSRRLLHSRSKARFVEFNLPASSSTKLSTVSQDPHNCDSDSDDEDGDDKGHGQTSDNAEDQKNNPMLTFRNAIKWAAVVVFSAALVLSLTLPSLSHRIICGLTVWKWCLTLLVVFCGRLFTGWLVNYVVFLIEGNFMLREQVLYFINGLRRGVRNCLWLGFVLLVWTLVFDAGVKTSARNHHVLNKITLLLITILVGSFFWLVKIVVVDMLALWFYVSTFFDRMKESVFDQHILDKLSGKPLDEISKDATVPKSMEGKMGFERLRRLSKRKASAGRVKDLVRHVSSKGLYAMDEASGKEEEIKSEYEAKQAGRRIFDNIDRNRDK